LDVGEPILHQWRFHVAAIASAPRGGQPMTLLATSGFVTAHVVAAGSCGFTFLTTDPLYRHLGRVTGALVETDRILSTSGGKSRAACSASSSLPAWTRSTAALDAVVSSSSTLSPPYSAASLLAIFLGDVAYSQPW